MAIKAKGFVAAEATTPNLDAVTTEGNTTTNSITVGGVSIGTAYSLPTSDGAANQVLQTDGSGGVTFQTLDVTGGLEYKGSFNATAGTPSLANAEKGDFYVVDTAGTIYGQTWGVGDHLLINEDMGGTITNSKIDKIDNTDQVTSVNGQTGAVTLTASDVSALASGDNVSELTNDAGYLTSAPVTSVNTQTGAVTLTASDVSALASGDNVSELTNDAGYLTSAPVTSVNSLTGAITLSGDDIAADHTATNYTAANANIDGHLSGIDTALGTALAPTLDSVTDNGATTTNDISVGGIISAGNIVSDADGTRTLGTEANRYITLFGDVNGAVRFKAKNDSGSAMTKGQVVYIKGISGTVPTVDLADADVSSKMPAFGLVYANANDQAEVQIVSFGNLTGLNTSSFSAGDTLYVSTTAGTLTATKPSGESAALQNIGRVVRSHASDGVVIVGGAGRSAATPNLDQNKLFLGNASNQAVSTALSSIALSSLNDDLSYLEPANNLSDVSNASTARTNLGLAIGSDVQAYDAQLADVAGLTPTDGNIIIGNGTNFITESGSTARESLGLGTAATEDVGTTANDIVQLDGSARLPAVDGSQLTNLPSATVALDGIDPGTGDATLATDGNITIDAQASDSDIIFKGTDGGVDTTFVTIDGSDSGTIIGNHDLELSTNGSEIRMGDDVTIRHVNDDGLEILIDSSEESNFDPSLRITATQAHTWGPRLFFRHTGSINANDTMGSVVFEGRNNAGDQEQFARIDGIKIDGTDDAEDGTLRLIARSNGSLLNNNGLLIQGDSGNVFVTVPGHDGSTNGLKLGSTLVTATAAELNTLDGITATTAELNVLDGITATTAELNTLDGITASTTELNFLDTSAQSPSANDVLTYNGTTLAWSAQAGGSVALDGIDPGTGDATLATNGNITIDAQLSNSDIIFRGTDGGVDKTFVTIDGSDAGTIKANGDLRLEHDGARIYFGADSDVYLEHQHELGLRLDMGAPGGGEPKFTIQSTNSTQNGPSIILDHNPATGTSAQIVSELVTNGIDSGGSTHTYTRMRSVSSVATADSEAGAYKFYVATGGTNAGFSGTEAFRIEGDSVGNRTVNVVQHDGSSSGLELAGTLVTATAAELNTLDGITASTTELNFLDTSAQSPSANDVLTYNGTTLAWAAQAGGGGGGLTYSAITANTTAQADYHYSCTGSITLTLPTSGISAGAEIRVKNMGTGTITIDPQTGTIDGSTTDRTLTDQYSALILISTGTNWEII